MSGDYAVHDAELAILHALARQQRRRCNRVAFVHIGRSNTAEAEELGL